MSRMLVAVAAATVALIAVAPAPALSGGRSLAATATAAVTAAAFALCATALRRPLLAAVVVLCVPLLKVTVVVATAAEGPAAAIASDAMAEDAALSAFVAAIIAMFLFVAPSSDTTPKAVSAHHVPEGEYTDKTLACGEDQSNDCTASWVSTTACTGLWLAFGIFAGLLLAATVLAVPAVPSAIAPFVAAIVVLIAIVASVCSSASSSSPILPDDENGAEGEFEDAHDAEVTAECDEGQHIENNGGHRVVRVVADTACPTTEPLSAVQAHTTADDCLASSSTSSARGATATTTTEESCRQRCIAALSATRPDFPTLLALFAIVAVAVVTTCDFVVVSDDVASLVLRCDAGMFLFGATVHESTAVDGVAVSLLRLLTLTCVLPLMVASIAASFRMEIEEEESVAAGRVMV